MRDDWLPPQQGLEARALQSEHLTACLGADRRGSRCVIQQGHLPEEVAPAQLCLPRFTAPLRPRQIHTETPIGDYVKTVSRLARSAHVLAWTNRQRLGAGGESRQGDPVEWREQIDARQQVGLWQAQRGACGCVIRIERIDATC